MEFVIGVAIAVVVTALFGSRKKKQPKGEVTKHDDEELITVVLPTIKHDN